MYQRGYIMNRRRYLQIVGAGVVGASLPKLNRSAVGANPGIGRAKSVLIVLLSGGPSQLDTLDPKPEAPPEIRGEFASIGTTIPGISICEHLPQLAQQISRWSIVRTLAHLEH